MIRMIVRCAVAAQLLLPPPAAQAMDFTFKLLDGDLNRGVIVAKNKIEPGDDEKLHRFVGELPASTVLVAVMLDSAGGNLAEGVKLATTIRNTSLTTAAVGTCASACFLMFAAGTKKMSFDEARIGVHSASLHGVETMESQAITTRMARTASGLGVPASIVGKMVTTPASDIAWLTPAELQSMNVELVNTQHASYQPGAPLRPGSAALASTSSPASAPAEASQGFVAGRRARMEYEAWFNGLAGDARAGAEWWAGVRAQAQRNRLQCDAGVPLWALGCKQAQTALASSDTRRRADPEFRAGWNSL